MTIIIIPIMNPVICFPVVCLVALHLQQDQPQGFHNDEHFTIDERIYRKIYKKNSKTVVVVY